MRKLRASLGTAWRCVVAGCAVMLVIPGLLRGQQVIQEALSSFPDDTQQLAFMNLAELRSSPNYLKIRQRMFTPQIRSFEEFLRTMGTDPEKDVDAVVLGWRGAPADTANFFGLAEGRFQPERARQYFEKSQLPSRRHADQDLYAFGSGEDPHDLFFAFLSPSLAAFGRLSDLAAVIDARGGERRAVNSNSKLMEWEGELEGTAPQWGVLTGKGAANMAAPWLTGSGKLSADPSVVLAPVVAILYRLDWSSGITTHFSIICQNSESAETLAKLLGLLRDAQQAAATASPLPLTGVEVQSNGQRVALNFSTSLEILDSLARGASPDPEH